jgi:hypothetical protein
MKLTDAYFHVTHWCLKGQSIAFFFLIQLYLWALVMMTPWNNSVVPISYEELNFRLPDWGTNLMCLPILSSCRIWGSHSSGYEEFYIVGYNVVYSVENQPVFRRNISPQSSGSKNKPSKKAAELAILFMMVSCLDYSLTVKMEGTFLRNVGWLTTDYTAFYLRR